MAFGRKRNKNNPYANCDICGHRIHSDADRVLEYSEPADFDSIQFALGVRCVKCDYEGLCEQLRAQEDSSKREAA